MTGDGDAGAARIGRLVENGHNEARRGLELLHSGDFDDAGHAFREAAQYAEALDTEAAEVDEFR